MKPICFAFVLFAVVVTGCRQQAFTPLYHEETLSSGEKVKVTSFNLVWGGRPGDDGCTGGSDCLSLEFVSNHPAAAAATKEKEARDVFELIRPASEQWGFTNAEVLGFRQVQRTGDYDIFLFNRTNGIWTLEHKTMPVFAK